MNDNHDPNDLSWLDDPNGQADLNNNSDQPDWDLPPLDSDEPLGDFSAMGDDNEFASLFGGLEELQPVSDDPAVVTDEIPSWLQASAPTGLTQDLPVIEDLVQLGQPATSDTEGIPSWLDTQELAAVPVANKEDVPPWLAEADETSEEVFAEEEAKAEALPTIARGDEASFLPPWLQDADDLGAEEANAFKSSFDDLDFAVDEQAESGGVIDPFGGLVTDTPTSSAAFGNDMPDWMRTREQTSVPQDDLTALLSDMPTIPGETTDPLLSNLLAGIGGTSEGDVDLDLLSLLEQTDAGASIKTGMLAPLEERATPPTSKKVVTDDFPDFATLMAQPDSTPDYHPLLEDPAPEPDAPFDFAALGIDMSNPYPSPDSDVFGDEAPAYQTSDDFVDLPVETTEDFALPSFDDLSTETPASDLPSFAAPPTPPRPDFAPPVLPVRPPAKPTRSDDDDFDSFLTSLRGDDSALDAALSDDRSLNLSSLLRDPGFSDLPDISPATSEVAPVVPDFLRDVSVREASVAALLRQQQDIPVEDLPEELRALHGELAAIPSSASSPATGLPMLPNIPLGGSAKPASGLSDSQRRGAELLRSLSGVGNVAADEAVAAVQATQKRTQRRRLGINITRLLLVAALSVAVVLPFVSESDSLKVGIQPPVVFAPSSNGGLTYSFIESLPAGSLVLFSVDYTPGSIAEIDALTIPLLRHAFVRGLKPIIIGSDPVTLQHVGRLADSAAQGGTRNVNYVVGRYLIGEAMGTQDFVQNIGVLLQNDLNGLPTQLSITGFDDFVGVIVLSDRADSVRTWAEQVVPRAAVPLVVGVGAAAAPLSSPYVMGGRVLVGLRDGMTYSRQLEAQYPPDTFILPVLPTATPPELSPTATEEITPVVTEEVTVQPTVERDVTVTAQATDATIEPTVAATLEPTIEATVATALPEPTVTMTTSPEPTVEPTATADGGSTQSTPGPTLSFTVFAVITGTDRVNVRQGPGTDFQILTSVAPGERFRVISGSSDGQWLQIQVDEDRTGWVSAIRVQIEQTESGAPIIRVGAGGLYQAQPLSVELTPERRWYAISLGAVVAAVLIALGSLIGIFRIILRRRR